MTTFDEKKAWVKNFIEHKDGIVSTMDIVHECEGIDSYSDALTVLGYLEFREKSVQHVWGGYVLR